tara:strand:+ start:383 stop:547 length:165 start_codon:yes stop_codon:yes gene_type:complete
MRKEEKIIKQAKKLVNALLHDEGQTKLNFNTVTGKNEIELLIKLDKALKEYNLK